MRIYVYIYMCVCMCVCVYVCTGVHFLGLGHSFIKYPKNVQEVEMREKNAIYARTKDGLVVVLDVRCVCVCV